VVYSGQLTKRQVEIIRFSISSMVSSFADEDNAALCLGCPSIKALERELWDIENIFLIAEGRSPKVDDPLPPPSPPIPKRKGKGV
jgi:hypothetical protein